ncbi:MAG: signal recognition particle-docking protein FtsY [Ignavibacteriales bacterium]|nr:signal recognition particle-docking protein FtsY [Ignavibacteriales bacterium]MCB9209868.1 signal recognition particle-docking protein FtsY [Ignavibacteriales bacterium]MCB9260304.1 signal recognition particle-docking protein FtsY [Ignavibacteriales bacterium]
MKLFKNLNFGKLKGGLSKTRNKLVNSITETISGKAIIDENVLDDLEETLITSDIGIETSEKIIDATRKSLKSDKDRTSENVLNVIKSELIRNLELNNNGLTEYSNFEKYKPYVILVVGVNGAGKTTTIGKLAHNYKKAGLEVVIGSADTFRAAANEQLEIWAKRAGVEVIQREHGADPSAVAFDTLTVAKKKNADVVIIDTAGRLHTKTNLMEELKKIKRVLAKVLDYAPNDTFLVIDGNTGQNGLIQAREFSKVTELTGLIVTKLDGTAKGGIIFQITAEQKIPVRYIGVGESIDDLQTFDEKEFVNAIFG